MPGVVVAAPPTSPPRNGILVGGKIPTDPPGTRWQEGLQYDSEACAYVASYNPCDDDLDFGHATDPADVDYTPPGIVSGTLCSTLDRTPEEAVARARRQLEACTSRQIEDELWRGTIRRSSDPDLPNLYLANSETTDTISAGAKSPTGGLACLERYILDCQCGGRGTIHATGEVATYWSSLGLIRRDLASGMLLTALDTIVIVGEGYDGSGPGTPGAGPAAVGSTLWAYATGIVEVRLEDPIILTPVASIAAAVERGRNDLEVFATRRFAATYGPCCAGAIELDILPCGNL